MQSIAEFDELFRGIAVPVTRDYSRLSTSPSQYVDNDSSYFQRNNCNPPVECDTPVKMKLPKDPEALLIEHTNENFLNGSGSSSTASTKSFVADTREPLKVSPSNEADQLIVDFSKMAMFAPQQPEERLSQRRRSEQKQKEDRRSAINSKPEPIGSINRARSNSVQREQSSIPRAPSAQRTATSGAPRSRSNSVQRAPSVPKTTTTPGVVTRSMAKLSQQNSLTANKIDPVPVKPAIRRSVMPLKVVVRTPMATSLQIANDRSRDRTRRVNTTAQVDPNTRRSIMTNRTPVTTQPRRANSLTRENPTTATTIKTRPIATANRTSAVGTVSTKPHTEADSTIAAKPTGVNAAANRNRVPLRVKPSTPVSTARPAFNSANRPTRVISKPATPSGNMKSAGSETDLAQKKPISSNYANALFNRLSTPKAGPSSRPVPSTSTPKQASNLRKSAVRPVPNFVRKVNSLGLPTGAGTHGIRAPSRGRTPSKDRINPAPEQPLSADK